LFKIYILVAYALVAARTHLAAYAMRTKAYAVRYMRFLEPLRCRTRALHCKTCWNAPPSAFFKTLVSSLSLQQI